MRFSVGAKQPEANVSPQQTNLRLLRPYSCYPKQVQAQAPNFRISAHGPGTRECSPWEGSP
jgi:hypothetical protein